MMMLRCHLGPDYIEHFLKSLTRLRMEVFTQTKNGAIATLGPGHTSSFLPPIVFYHNKSYFAMYS